MNLIVKQPLAVDVSYYEPVSDWSLCDPQPAHIIGRASYGVRKDTYFLKHMAEAKRLGISRAAYHYLYAVPLLRGQSLSASIGDQAENFIAQIRAAGFTQNDTMWLDWEAYGNDKAPGGLKLQAAIKQWLDHVERETGVRPGIYSRKDQLDRMAVFGAMPKWINDYMYWLAWYPYHPNDFDEFPVNNQRLYPKYIKPENLAMWQYSESGLIVPKAGMEDRHQTTFDLNMMYPWYYLKVTGVPGPNPNIDPELERFEAWWKTVEDRMEMMDKPPAREAWVASAKVDRCR